MKQSAWARTILGLVLTTMMLLACTFTVDVLPTETPSMPTFTPAPATFTPVPFTLEAPSATPTLISIRDGTYTMLEITASHELGDVVRGLAFTPDGTVLAAAGGNGSKGIVQLWDVVNDQSLGTLDGHTDIVWGAAFSPNGRFLVTVSSDKTAKIWDWHNKALIKSLDFPGAVVSVGFSPDGQTLAVGGVAEVENQIQYASVWTFQIDSWQPLMRYSEYTNILAMAFSPKGGTLVGGGTSRNVQVWRTSDGKTMFTLNHAHQVFEAAISPDGTTVATGTCIKVMNSDCTEGGIWIWDLPTGRLLKKLGSFPDAVEALAFTSDGTTLIAGSRDGTLRFYATADYVSRFETISPGGLTTFTLSPENGLLATGAQNGQVHIWKAVYHP
jgi:WD40 repeat protein